MRTLICLCCFVLGLAANDCNEDPNFGIDDLPKPQPGDDWPKDVPATDLAAPIFLVQNGRVIAEAESLIGPNFGNEWAVANIPDYYAKGPPPTGGQFVIATGPRRGITLSPTDFPPTPSINPTILFQLARKRIGCNFVFMSPKVKRAPIVLVGVRPTSALTVITTCFLLPPVLITMLSTEVVGRLRVHLILIRARKAVRENHQRQRTWYL